jgi:hypothetical protein
LKYPAQHAFSVNILLNYVDMILENDPDAVIVLQGDHGLHGLQRGDQHFPREEAKRLLNVTDEELPAIWNHVISAIRLPRGKMTQETQEILSDPRNISRYLINEYVGQNYEYIPSRFKQTYALPETDREKAFFQ